MSKLGYRNFHNKKRRLHQLECGISGFLCTCNSKLKEKDCIREAYGILNEFADELFGGENESTKVETGITSEDEVKTTLDDVDESLKREIQSIKNELNRKPESRRFQAVESGANGIVFIRTTVPDPVNLAHSIMSSMSHIQRSKFLLRLLPVEITCKAYLDDICKACALLFDKYFSEVKTFAVIFNHRNNDSLNRDEVIEKVADLILKKNGNNKVDLKNPQLAVLIEVIRSICCISVVPDFYKFKKYNLLELMIQNKSEANNEEKTEVCGEQK